VRHCICNCIHDELKIDDQLGLQADYIWKKKTWIDKSYSYRRVLPCCTYNEDKTWTCQRQNRRLRLCILRSGKIGVYVHPWHAHGSDKLGPHLCPQRWLRLNRLWHRHPSSMILTRLRHTPHLCARCFVCGYLNTVTLTTTSTTATPRTATTTKVSGAQSSRLPRHWQQGLSPRLSTSPAFSTFQASEMRHRPWHSRSYNRGYQPLVLLQGHENKKPSSR
jgi:hypothetical protein